MKNRANTAWGIGALALVALAGCNKQSTDGGAPSASAPAASGSAAEASGPLTLEQYEQLIVALASCKTVESESTYYGSIDGSCPAYKALQAARAKKDAMKNISGKTAPLTRKLLGHASPAVRVQAAGMVESLFGTTGDNQKAVTDLARSEKDIAVLKALIHAVSNDGKKNPEVGAMLLSLAGHENPRVRATAAVGISSSWNKGMPGAVEKLIQIMQSDADPRTRQAACAYAGEHDDDRLLPVYGKLTGPGAEPALAAECFTGLLRMWASYPLFANANEKAYRLSLKVLAQKPRTDKLPPWTTMGTFENVGKGKGTSFDKWVARAKWYDRKEVKKAMLEVAADKGGNWLGRAGAVRAAVANGATKAELEALKKKLGDDRQVVSQIDKSMAEAR